MEQQKHTVFAQCVMCGAELLVRFPEGKAEGTCGKCGKKFGEFVEKKNKNNMEQKTLRDEFAMAALTGLLANEQFITLISLDTGSYPHSAYKVADDMLKEREKQNKE